MLQNNQTDDFSIATTTTSSSLLIQLLLGFLLFTITIWTIFGNILVVVAFFLEKNLRQGGISNYLILNLAVSDLLLGVAVLPFSASYSTFGIWHFGEIICEIWLVIDVLCSTASIWSLLLIAFDRYIATNYPIHYRSHRRSINIVLISTLIVWFVSFGICQLPTLFFENLSIRKNSSSNIRTKKYHSTTKQCELYKDLNFVFTSSLLSFYIPLIMMIFLYSKVFYVLRKKTMKFKKNPPLSPKKVLPSALTSNESLTLTDQHAVARRELRSELRLTRSLAIVIGCFIFCWFPFFTLYIIRAQCHCLSFNAIEFFVWLGYSNSSINPVLYAILNKNFRHALQNLFALLRRKCFSCSSLD